MKIATPAALFLFAFAAFDGASASTVAQREYKRCYNDCLAGRFDQEQHGASYKKGCRAAEDKRDAKPAATGPANSADSMMSKCRARAAAAYKASAASIDVKYEGQRVDGTHAVNGTNNAKSPPATFQCSFNKSGAKIVRFIRN